MTRALLLLPLAACATGAMTTPEALEALDQAVRSDAGIQVTAESVEISTTFTLGSAVEAAAEELAAFWESQAPCTDVGLDGATLEIDYGTLDDACVYAGRTWAGVSAITVVGAADGAVEVDHVWTGLTDGFHQVDGSARVSWDGRALTRSVDTTHTWTELATGETVDVTGQHVMGSLEATGFFDGGITLDGDRQWVDDAGEAWDLAIDGVEARWIDPAPQAGTLTVTNPDGKVLDIAFSRLDEATIRAEVTGTRRPITLDITALGQVTVVE